jgi:hypothetical protein
MVPRGSSLVPEGPVWFQEVPTWFPEGPKNRYLGTRYLFSESTLAKIQEAREGEGAADIQPRVLVETKLVLGTGGKNKSHEKFFFGGKKKKLLLLLTAKGLARLKARNKEREQGITGTQRFPHLFREPFPVPVGNAEGWMFS